MEEYWNIVENVCDGNNNGDEQTNAPIPRINLMESMQAQSMLASAPNEKNQSELSGLNFNYGSSMTFTNLDYIKHMLRMNNEPEKTVEATQINVNEHLNETTDINEHDLIATQVLNDLSPNLSPVRHESNSFSLSFERFKQSINENNNYESGLGTLSNENLQLESHQKNHQEIEEAQNLEAIDNHSLVDENERLQEDQISLHSFNITPEICSTPIIYDDQLKQANELIKQLQAKIERQQKQLNKEAELKENENMIKVLQLEKKIQSEQLKKNAELISNLMAEKDEKEEKLSLTKVELDMMKSVLIQIGGRKVINVLEDQASKCYSKKMYGEAIKLYQQAIDIVRLEPEKDYFKLAELYLWIAQIYYEFNDYNKAIEFSSTALRCRPKCLFSLDVRSKSYFALAQYELACKDLEELMRLDRKDREARLLYYRTWSRIKEQRREANDDL